MKKLTFTSTEGLFVLKGCCIKMRLALFAFILLSTNTLWSQLYWNTNGTNALLNTANWSTVAEGPFTTAWADGSNINFSANSAMTYVTAIPVGNITLSDGITVTLTAAGTFSTGAAVRTIDVGTGSTLTWNGQGVSTAAGTGFAKSGNGVWNIGAQANLYPGGFTLNAGTVILGGVNALGVGGALTINGGTIAATAARDLSAKFAGGIMIGGDFQLGSLVSPAVGSSNLTFSNSVDLGGATRVITIGGTGVYTFSGIISNGGITLNNALGATVLLSGANLYTGPTVLNGGSLKLNPSASITNATPYTLNGGILSTAGITAARTITASTLQLTNTTTLDLGSNAHTLTFAASDAVAWTSSKMLIVSGWAGVAGGSGTLGKLFVGNSATGLTADQLSQIRFVGFPGSAMILSTGEVVPSTAAAFTMSGAYKVGITEVSPNFTSLNDAVIALNSSNITGNIILEISSDLTEPANIGLGVNTNGFGITIRPDADADRTITFTQLNDNASPTGHFVIGYQCVAAAWSDANIIATNNVTIDGFAVGGTTKRLKFTNRNADVVGARVLVVVGASQNTVIKNCIVENKTTNGSSPACIVAVVRKGTAIEVAPTNFTIDNTTLMATASSVGMGMRITSSGTLVAIPKIAGFIFRNNTVTVTRRLVELNYLSGVTEMYNNVFNLNQSTSAGSLVYGIFANAGILGTVNIYNNKFNQAAVTETGASGAFGVRLMSLSSDPTAWNIYNNTFSGMNRTQPSGAATLNLSYIQVAFGKANIYHNTFYMPALTSPAAAGYYHAINNSNAQVDQKIRNNIFISDEPTAACAFVSNLCVSPGVSENNLYFHRQTNTNAKIVAAYADLLSYQGANATLDVNSKSTNVTFTNAASCDFSLMTPSLGDVNLRVPRLATVTTDFMGAARKTYTYAGAYDAGDLNPTKTFTVTVPNGTAKVYVAGTFLDKVWDVTNPLELTPTANLNEFSAALPCENAVEYKYLCEKGDWDYSEAVYQGGGDPTALAVNRTYAAADLVPIWFRVKSLKLNVSFATAVPSKLFVKGSWDAFATPIELTKSGNAFSTTLTGILNDKISANTQYKYYTNDMAAGNWENTADNSAKDNRWSICPVMNDQVARFTTLVTTNVNEVVVEARIMRTDIGIEVVVDGQSTIELYTINGVLIEKTKVDAVYTRNLNNGVYIIRINGKATKFIK